MSTTRRTSIRSSLWQRKSARAPSRTSQHLDNSCLPPTCHDTKSPDPNNTDSTLFTVMSQEIPTSSSAILLVLDRCKDEIITRGLSVEGIFRRSGSAAMIEKLMHEFRRADDPRLIDLSHVPIHTVAGLFKKCLQQLSEPVIPQSFQIELLDAYESTPSKPDVHEKRSRLIAACQALPKKHCELLSFVLLIAHTISHHSDRNKMSAENLAIIFAPTCVRLDGVSDLLPDNNSKYSRSNSSSTSNNNNNNTTAESDKSSSSPLRSKTTIFRTVSRMRQPSQSSKTPSTTSSFMSLPCRDRGFGVLCRSILSRTKFPTSSSTSSVDKSQRTCPVPRYEPNKLMQLDLVKDNTRWNQLFEFMINEPPLPLFGNPDQPLSPVATTSEATATAAVEVPNIHPPQGASPDTVYYDTLEDNEDGVSIMTEVIGETLAALSDETAEFFGSILQSNLVERELSPATTTTLGVNNDTEDTASVHFSGTSYDVVLKHSQEEETKPMPQLWKRNSITHHHRQKHGNDWLKSLSQNIDFASPSKKRPVSLSFIPKTQARLSTFIR